MGAEDPKEEAPRAAAASTAAGAPVVAAALMEVEARAEEAFLAAAFVAADTLTSAGADILSRLPAALGAGRPCGPLIWAGAT